MGLAIETALYRKTNPALITSKNDVWNIYKNCFCQQYKKQYGISKICYKAKGKENVCGGMKRVRWVIDIEMYTAGPLFYTVMSHIAFVTVSKILVTVTVSKIIFLPFTLVKLGSTVICILSAVMTTSFSMPLIRFQDTSKSKGSKDSKPVETKNREPRTSDALKNKNKEKPKPVEKSDPKKAKSKKDPSPAKITRVPSKEE